MKEKDEILPNTVSIILHDRLRIVLDVEENKSKYSSTLLIIDEFHKTLDKTLRTSYTLEAASLCHSFIAMTGTLYKDEKIENLFPWLQLLYKYEVTTKNYWIAIAGIISIKSNTKIKVVRDIVEESLTEEEKEIYYKYLPISLGGKANSIDFKALLKVSYEATTRRLINECMKYIEDGEKGIFLVAKNYTHADILKELLKEKGVNDTDIAIINSKNPLSLPSSSTSNLKVVITTPKHSEGYDMTIFGVMITGVYFSNEATREQLERRINRLSQTREEVRIILVHAGILTYIHERYENVRNIATALKSLSHDIGEVIEI